MVCILFQTLSLPDAPLETGSGVEPQQHRSKLLSFHGPVETWPPSKVAPATH